MYLHTVVPTNELKMNLETVIQFTESLKAHCKKDEQAAELLKIHTKALKAVATAEKTPEQIALNITNLEKIKAMIGRNSQPKQARPQSVYSLGGAA